MRTDPLYRKITVDEFLSIDFPPDRKFELADGVIVGMTGGTAAHARVARNILVSVQPKLRGTGCGAYGSDMAVGVGDGSVRYPDVSIYCGNPDRPDNDASTAFSDPRVVFEVMSPSTTQIDQGEKLAEYRALPSLDTIVFVDPANELTRVVQRLGPTSWRDDMFAQPHDVELPALGLTIPHDEIFARD